MASLTEMSLDEFMENWDSDESEPSKSKSVEISPKKAKKSKPGKKKRKQTKVASDGKDEEAQDARGVLTQDAAKGTGTSSHQKELNDLKERDPEFYKFLQQEDESLLHFEDGEFDLDGSSDEESESGIHKIPVELEEASDSESESIEDQSELDEIEKDTKKGDQKLTLVTSKMIEDWKSKLIQEKSSFPALKELMKSFRAAILRFSDSEEDEGKKSKKQKSKYKVVNAEVFNAIVGLCIQQVIPSLVKILGLSQQKSSINHVTLRKSKSWVKVRDVVQIYLGDVIALNELLLEPSVLCASLRHTILLIPYFINFPKVAKQLIKFLIKTWSGSEDESVRVLSFLCINRIVKLDEKKFLEITMKQCYLAYVANCKFTTPTLLPMINFLQQTLCELFAVNPQATYPLAFLYIRQLAIHLRKAITVPKKENYQAVYNWQYVHCIGLWCRMVGNLYSKEAIKPLLYPLVQVSLGTIDLVPTSRYFPLRYRVIKYLITLSSRTNTYIPLLPYITKPLRLAEFSKKSGMVTEPLNFATMLRLSNSQLKEASYRSGTMDEMYDALMEYFNTQAHTISFPEMVVPTMISMKKFAKGCKVANYSKIVLQLISKMEENSKLIIDKRSKVSFGVADVDKVMQWEKMMEKEGVPFHKHYKNYKKMRQTESRHAVADKDRNVEERLPQVDRKKFIELAKAKDRKELSNLFDDDDENFDVEENILKKLEEEESTKITESKSSKKRKKISERKAAEKELDDPAYDSDDDSSKKPKEVVKRRKVVVDNDDDEPDLVEEFQFSSDEN